jgi:hypothetical protein
MRLAAVADSHIANHRRFGGDVAAGVNRRCREALSALRGAVHRAAEEHCALFAVLGDLFDTTRPEPQVIAATQDVLKDTASLLMLGNHEQVSSEDGDHALGPMAPLAGVFSVPRIVRGKGANVIVVPFRSGPAVEWLPKALDELLLPDNGRAKAEVLLLHLGIIDGATPPWLRDAPDAIPLEVLMALCEKHGIAAALAGNWHTHRLWTRKGKPLICQVGALAPTGWDNPGLEGYGSLVIWDSEKPGEVQVEEIHGPRFVKSRAGELVAFPTAEGCSIYLSLRSTQEEIAAGNEQVRALTEEGRIVGGEVILDDEEVRTAARAAARVARSADTLEEALTGFVDQMALPEGVSRDAVLAASRKYLGV